MSSLLLLMAVLAHHESAVGRIDPPNQLVMDSRLTGAKLEATSGYVFTRFDAVAPTGGVFTGDDTSLDVHALILSSRWFSESGWTLSASATGGISGEQPGLGDATLSAGRWLKFGGLAVVSELGFVLPTGRYEPDATRSASQLATTSAGGLDLRTSDTRTSLGADTFAAQWLTRTAWTLGAIEPGVSVLVRQPLTETRDEILWGTDVVVGASLFSALIRGIGVTGDVTYIRHWADRLEVQSAEDGVVRRARLGGRQIVSAGLAVSFSWSDSGACGVGGRVPLARQTETIQWVESYSINVQCSAGFGL